MSEPEYEQVHGNQRSLAGGGKVEYAVQHMDDEVARMVAQKFETAIEMQKARYFGETPARRLSRSCNNKHKHSVIRDAIESANENPSFAKHSEGEMRYIVEEAYYPDDYSHYVEVTAIPAHDRGRALLHAQSELVQRGYGINSIRCDEQGHLTKFHVVSLTWFYSSRAYGRQKHDAAQKGSNQE